MIKETDIQIDVFSTGREKWLRIRHLPTGIVVTSTEPVQGIFKERGRLLAKLNQRVVNNMSDDLPEARAYVHYSFDCPECSEEIEADPKDTDPTGTEQICENCGTHVWVFETI